MNRKTSGKRGAVIIALIAALAALAGPGAATAAAATPSTYSAPAPIASVFGGVGILASWAEGASWAEE